MTTARDIMHTGAECIGEHQTLQHAAQRMRDLDVGALPICGDDDRLRGIITDRDIIKDAGACRKGSRFGAVAHIECFQGCKSVEVIRWHTLPHSPPLIDQSHDPSKGRSRGRCSAYPIKLDVPRGIVSTGALDTEQVRIVPSRRSQCYIR